MDAITNKLANALNDLYLECRAQGLTSRDGYMDEASMILQEYRELAGKEILAATDAQADMDDEPQPLHVLVMGNPREGFTVTGPFDSNESAMDYADEINPEWWIFQLDKPEER